MNHQPIPPMDPFILDTPADARYSTEIDWHLKEGQYFNFMGQISCSVVKAKRIVQGTAHYIVDLPVNQYIDLSNSITGAAEAPVDLDIPCIMGLFPQEHGRQHKHFIMCVDGHNRIREADKQGKTTFRAIILTAEETHVTRN